MNTQIAENITAQDIKDFNLLFKNINVELELEKMKYASIPEKIKTNERSLRQFIFKWLTKADKESDI